MIEEENDPSLISEGEQAVEDVEKAIDEAAADDECSTASTTTTTPS